MVTDHTSCARYMADGRPHIQKAPRAAAFCRQTSLRRTVFAITLVVLAGMLPAVASSSVNSPSSSQIFDSQMDRNNNGVEDLLDAWLSGQKNWLQLRTEAAPVIGPENKAGDGGNFPPGDHPVEAVWAANQLRIICLGSNSSDTQEAVEKAQKSDPFRLAVHRGRGR